MAIVDLIHHGRRANCCLSHNSFIEKVILWQQKKAFPFSVTNALVTISLTLVRSINSQRMETPEDKTRLMMPVRRQNAQKTIWNRERSSIRQTTLAVGNQKRYY